MPAEVLAARVDALEALLPSSAPEAGGGGGGDRGAAAGSSSLSSGRLPAVLMRRPRVLLRSPAAVARLVESASQALGLRAREVARIVAGQPTLLGSGPQTLARRYRRLLALAGREPSGAWARCLGSMSPSGLGRCLAASDAALDRLQALLDAGVTVVVGEEEEVAGEAGGGEQQTGLLAAGGQGASSSSSPSSSSGLPRGRRVRIRSGVVWLDDMKALLALPRGAFAQLADKLGVEGFAAAAAGEGGAGAAADEAEEEDELMAL